VINGKSVLGLIPARGGSRGLKRKNLLEFHGKPLIAWSILAGLESRYVDLCLVSTEDEEIARIASKYGAEVPFLRPQELATDTSPTIDTVLQTLKELEIKSKFSPDYVVLLEPTSPIRNLFDVDRIVEKLDDLSHEYDSIISVGEAPCHPSILRRIVGDSLEPYEPESIVQSRRQDNETLYFPFGVAYVAKTATLKVEKTFYAKRTTHYKLDRNQCIEIDDLFDFKCAEIFMEARVK
jgi:CMP-N,N'-diacetyllegionaminic acid synthase